MDGPRVAGGSRLHEQIRRLELRRAPVGARDARRLALPRNRRTQSLQSPQVRVSHGKAHQLLVSAVSFAIFFFISYIFFF